MAILRRHDLSPRIEVMPLIDVIFLLLTFFIYTMITMVQAQILPVQLQALTTGETAEPTSVVAITVDAQGELYLNRQPIDSEALDDRLKRMASEDDPPKLFLALEETRGDEPAGASVDRGPLLISLIERVRRAGLTEFHIVGERAAP